MCFGTRKVDRETQETEGRKDYLWKPHGSIKMFQSAHSAFSREKQLDKSPIISGLCLSQNIALPALPGTLAGACEEAEST